MAEIEIRKMTPDDIDNASKIFYDAQGPSGNGEEWSLKTGRDYVSENLGDCSFVAVDEQIPKIVGFCLGSVATFEKGPELLIQMIAVQPEDQRSSIGTLLYEKLVEEAKLRNCTGMRLVAKQGHYSYSWYEKIGFKETGYVEMHKSI